MLIFSRGGVYNNIAWYLKPTLSCDQFNKENYFPQNHSLHPHSSPFLGNYGWNKKWPCKLPCPGLLYSAQVWLVASLELTQNI